MVRPETLVAGRAFGQRIDERVEVTGGCPDLLGENDRGVDADNIVALLHHAAPPLTADVFLELNAEWAVVPGRPRTAVNLAGRKDEAPALGQADDGIDAVGRHERDPPGAPPAGCRRVSRERISGA